MKDLNSYSQNKMRLHCDVQESQWGNSAIQEQRSAPLRNVSIGINWIQWLSDREKVEIE